MRKKRRDRHGMSTKTSAVTVGHPIDPQAGWQPPQRQSLLSHARWLDVLMMFFWVAFTTIPAGGWAAALRYLAAAYFLVAMFMFARQTMPAVLRSWPAFALTLLCLLSTLWAPAPDETLRKSLALFMTAVMAVYVGTRVKGPHILICYFIAEVVVAFMCLRSPTPINGAWTGVFGQKNYFAMHMFILYVSAMGLALDKANWKWLRLIALALIPLAGFMILMARSGTTTILLLGATAVILGHYFVWQPAKKIPHARLFIALLATVLGLAASLLVFGLLEIDIYERILGALGKDSTLTGRTYLWEIAQRTIDENPMTGVGGNGFWRPEYGWTDSIAKYFGYERFQGFSFHNSYYENGVMYGYPGMWATYLLAGWAIGSSALTWLRNQTVVNATFLIFVAMIVVRSTSESDLAGELSGTSVLLIIAASRKEFFGKRTAEPHARPVLSGSRL